MSDATQSEHDDSHEGPIKTPKQLMWTVVASFVLPVLIIIMLINFVALDHKPAAGSDALSAEAVARRIQPVGSSEYKDLSDAKSMQSGLQVYQAQCSVCHLAGVAAAPKLGDEGAWAARIKTGYDALLNSVLKGKGNMGAQGGGDFSDFEIARAVVYMANQGGAKLEEPKLPAPASASK